MRELPMGHRRPVSFFVPGALWNWNGSHVNQTGIGASEEGIVYLAERLAQDDWRPAVYGPVPEPEVYRSVEYAPRAQVRHVERGPIVVSRAPAAYGMLDRLTADRRPMILWLQDAWYFDLSPEVIARYEAIVVLTEWHKQAMHEQHGVPLEKLVVIPNFLRREHFAGVVERQPHHFVYASSPDRGLVSLLHLWPSIRELWPDASLDVFYGFEGAKKLASQPQRTDWVASYRALRAEWERWRYEPGITDRGRVDHRTIAREMQRAAAWPYPTIFRETQCLNAVKARAAGCVPVTTPLAGLLESARCDWSQFVPVEESMTDPFGGSYRDRFMAALQLAVATPESERRAMSQQALAEYDVEVVLPRWLALLEVV